ncbi:AIR synthase related protein [Halocatena halophila]|uniref:AIR synthase related protein n=1 Tax=Halocatena halophila TaxID=2814576 RepID=UPI002ED2B004
MVGKVPPSVLESLVFERFSGTDPTVLQGPAYGEDAAAIEFDDSILLVNTDPISMAIERIGTIGVTIAANDIAASGGTPRWLTQVCLLPEDGVDLLETITEGVATAADAIGVSVVGGHTETHAELDRPLLSMTCLGTTDRVVHTGGLSPGDRIVLAGYAGTEATAIAASDLTDELGAVDPSLIENGLDCYAELSVLESAHVVRNLATAMHDPTEGGVLAGLDELARSSALRIDTERDAIPIRDVTRTICDALAVDPLRTFGSGALLVGVSPEATETAIERLEAQNITGTVIGTARSGTPGVSLDENRLESPIEDDLYQFWT